MSRSIEPRAPKGASFTRDEARRVDRFAQERLALPGDLLMENAGAWVARSTLALARAKRRRRVVIVAGPGNNGGDGFVVARHLLGSIDVGVVLVGAASDDVAGDAKKNLLRLRALGVPVDELFDAAPLAQTLRRKPPPVVVDALFGTGLSRPVEGLARAVIEAINAARCPVVAVDLPSGLDCDTGRALGAVVKATVTVTFVRPKVGFTRGAGPSACGKVEIATIGFPPNAALDLMSSTLPHLR